MDETWTSAQIDAWLETLPASPLTDEEVQRAMTWFGRKMIQDARRYRYLVAQYARHRDLNGDGVPQWFLNSPYLGGVGQSYKTFDDALDADMARDAAGPG